MTMTLNINTSATNAAIPAQPIATTSAVEYPNPSPTAGMTIAQRILHVGGRNPPGSTYVEFGSIQAVEALVRQVLRDQPARDAGQTAPVNAAQYLGRADLSDLQRLEDLFDDGQCHSLPRVRIARLAELGVIRNHSSGYYSITAFGRLVLGDAISRLPLETIDECNARLCKEHASKMSAAIAAQQGDTK